MQLRLALDHGGDNLNQPAVVPPGPTLFNAVGLQVELESLLAISVDLLNPANMPQRP